jgi:hypothetical protein
MKAVDVEVNNQYVMHTQSDLQLIIDYSAH